MMMAMLRGRRLRPGSHRISSIDTVSAFGGGAGGGLGLEVEGGGGGGGGVDLADEVPDRGVPSLALLTDELGGERDRDRLD